MERTRIDRHVVGWHPGRQKGFVKLRLVTGQEVQVVANTAQEVAALAAILRELPCFFWEDGMIATDWEAGQ